MKVFSSRNIGFVVLFFILLVLIIGFNKIKTKSHKKRIREFSRITLHTKEPVEVLWNKFLVPRISAKTNKDLFYTVGVVQMHLRRTQLEFLRKVAKGEVSEMIGLKGHDIDHFIRSINFRGIATREYPNLSSETKQVLKYMAHGMNDYISQKKSRPLDMILLGISNEDWTPEDLATIHKFISLDINWMMFSKLVEFIDRPYFKKLWDSFFNPDLVNEILKSTTDVSKNFNPVPETNFLQWMGQSFTKAGSNAFAVGGRRTRSGSAILSNDPHLGIMIPNIWLFVVLESPTYKSMGYIMPSFPVPVVGRNHHIAWGGTNMWGLSTFLSEVSPNELAKAYTRKEILLTRFGRAKEVEIREVEGQPIITDSKLFSYVKPLTFFWVGSQSSDEVLAFLKLNQAKTWPQFREAFRTYSTSGQNFIYADKKGNIGKVAAIKQLQVEKGLSFPLTERPNSSWQYKTSEELPWFYNPVEFYLVSANDRWQVRDGQQELSVFQSPDDRVLRMQALLSQNDRVDFNYVKKLHLDVFSPSAFELKSTFISALQDLKAFKDHQSYLALKSWDGNYDIESKGALVFEVMLASLSEEFLTQKVKNLERYDLAQAHLQKLLTRSTSWRKTLIGFVKTEEFFKHQTPWQEALDKAKEQLEKYNSWGEFHQLTLAHPLSRLPLLDRFYFYKGPYPGGNETLLKAAHNMDTDKAPVTFGAQARWMTDLASLDANYFVLLGGQDGWLRSKNTNDQTALWLKGQYIHVPFNKEAFLKSEAVDF